MNYMSWNYRGVSFFKEEVIHCDGKNNNEFPSIKDFQQNGIYTSEIRKKLCSYLENCPEIVSTSYRRLNAYTLEPIFSLTYFTDGDFIFNNLFQEYIYYENFVLPQKWYELIKTRNYINDDFELNYERMSSGEIDIFNNFDRSFDDNSIICDVIL